MGATLSGLFFVGVVAVTFWALWITILPARWRIAAALRGAAPVSASPVSAAPLRRGPRTVMPAGAAGPRALRRAAA